MPHGNSACSTWTRRYLLNSNEKLMNGVVREAQTPLFEHPFKLIESEHTKPVEPWNLVAPKALALCVLGQANANKQPHLRARDWPSTVWSWWWEVGCGSDFRKFSKSTVRSVEFLDPQLTSSGWRKKFQLSHSFAESAVRHCFGSWIASFYGVEFVALVSKDTRLSFVESLLLEKLHKREMIFFSEKLLQFSVRSFEMLNSPQIQLLRHSDQAPNRSWWKYLRQTMLAHVCFLPVFMLLLKMAMFTVVSDEHKSTDQKQKKRKLSMLNYEPRLRIWSPEIGLPFKEPLSQSEKFASSSAIKASKLVPGIRRKVFSTPLCHPATTLEIDGDTKFLWPTRILYFLLFPVTGTWPKAQTEMRKFKCNLH